MRRLTLILTMILMSIGCEQPIYRLTPELIQQIQDEQTAAAAVKSLGLPTSRVQIGPVTVSVWEEGDGPGRRILSVSEAIGRYKVVSHANIR